MKLTIFKKEKKFRKGGFHTNPDICWEIELYVAFAVTLVILIFSVFLFMQINNGFTVGDESINASTEAVTKDRIDKVLQYFTVREEKSAQILSTPANIVDPSL